VTEAVPYPLPEPGPPFTVGETVAFFPCEIGPTPVWVRLDYAVIEDIDEEAELFSFHFVGEPGQRHAQGLENIVRVTPNYLAWREVWQEALRRTGDEFEAVRQTRQAWYRVVAESPIHGNGPNKPPGRHLRG
jgi:hypothetical protein